MAKVTQPETLVLEAVVEPINKNKREKMGLFDFLTQEIAIDLGTATHKLIIFG